MKLGERTTATLLIAIFMISAITVIVPVLAHDPTLQPRPKKNGWVHWVWIEYEWHSPEIDPEWGDYVTWSVYAYDCSGNPPKFEDASFGTLLRYNPTPSWGSWDENYKDNFELKGKTLQFDEEYVPGVDAHPQINHVVLHHVGSGVYVGKDTTYYTIAGRDDYVHMDVNMYEIHVDIEGEVVSYYFEEHEYYRYIGE